MVVSEFPFQDTAMACTTSLCTSTVYPMYSISGLMVGLAILILFLFRKEMGLKKYLIFQIILLLVFMNAFYHYGFSVGCCGDHAPERVVGSMWKLFLTDSVFLEALQKLHQLLT